MDSSMNKTKRCLTPGVSRAALGVGVVLALAGCQSEADKERESIARYAAQTAESCRGARANIVMVENARDIGGKPQSYKEGRAWAKTICQESVKAQDMQIKQAMKDLSAKR